MLEILSLHFKKEREREGESDPFKYHWLGRTDADIHQGGWQQEIFKIRFQQKGTAGKADPSAHLS